MIGLVGRVSGRAWTLWPACRVGDRVSPVLVPLYLDSLEWDVSKEAPFSCSRGALWGAGGSSGRGWAEVAGI